MVLECCLLINVLRYLDWNGNFLCMTVLILNLDEVHKLIQNETLTQFCMMYVFKWRCLHSCFSQITLSLFSANCDAADLVLVFKLMYLGVTLCLVHYWLNRGSYISCLVWSRGWLASSKIFIWVAVVMW